MRLLTIAASLSALLAFSCTESSVKTRAEVTHPDSSAPAPVERPADSAALPADSAKLPADSAKLPAPGEVAGREAQEKPARQAEAPFVPPQNYAAFLDELLPRLTAEDLAERQQAQRELERACAHAAAPGNESRRAELCRAMLARLGPETKPGARISFVGQLEKVGKADCVPDLGGLLEDRDPQVREAARRALQNMPVPAAGLALREALRRATAPEMQVALINALAARGETVALAVMLDLVNSEQPEVASAALAAVGDLGGVSEVAVLGALLDDADTARRAPAADVIVRIADRLAKAGEGRGAMPALWKISGDPVLPAAVRGAALRVLVVVDPRQALPLVQRALADETTPALRPVAARLLAEIPGDDVLFRIVMTLNTYPTEVQCILLDVVAERGSKGKLAVLAALDSNEEIVLVAALKALRKVGDVTDIPRLARLAALGEGDVRDAARGTLERLPGFNIEPALMLELDKDQEAGIRAEIIRALAHRNFKLAVPRLLALAEDASPVVRAAAYEALGRLATAETSAHLVGFLIAEKDEDAAKAAEDAIVELAQSDEDRRRAEPVLAALKDSSGIAAGRLLRVLGRLQGPAALAAIRAAVQSSDDIAADAAFRALADWPDPEVLDDLLQLAGSQNEIRHALALRGYLRLMRLPSERPAEQTLEMLKYAMSLARGADEQKLVLAAMGEVPHLAALTEVQNWLRKDELRDEAAAAVVSVAQGVALWYPDEARAALERIVAAGVGEGPTNQARQALQAIEKHAGTIGVWAVSVPCLAEGETYADVFAHEFEPETGRLAEIEWTPLTATRTDNPWVFDLNKIGKCSNCCVYARTAIWSENEQPARLELGSDDGVKVWLNGQLVHSNAASRGVTPGEDKVEIRLQRGWNPLLLKIVQAGGNWGFTCAVRDPAGQPIPDLKFDADR